MKTMPLKYKERDLQANIIVYLIRQMANKWLLNKVEGDKQK